MESPDIKKMIEEVKNTKWYTPGLLNEYDRELEVIRDKNKDIDSKFNVDDSKINELLRELPVGINEVRVNKKETNSNEENNKN